MPKLTTYSHAPPLARFVVLLKMEPTLQATRLHLEMQLVIGHNRKTVIG
jgi:hypothetical protein